MALMLGHLATPFQEGDKVTRGTPLRATRNSIPEPIIVIVLVLTVNVAIAIALVHSGAIGTVLAKEFDALWTALSELAGLPG